MMPYKYFFQDTPEGTVVMTLNKNATDNDVVNLKETIKGFNMTLRSGPSTTGVNIFFKNIFY